MSAVDSLREGKLDEALSQVKEAVRNNPADAKQRTFLFQLLAINGDWNRSGTQLEVAGELDAEALAMVQTYREAIHCEALRASVFAGQRSPLLIGEPEEWIALLMEAVRVAPTESKSHVASLREKAFEAAPATAGTIFTGDKPDGEPFEWIADGDTRLGPLLEAIVNGKYYWIPFDRIAQIDLEEPQDLRDFVWAPCHFTFINGGDTVALIPTRYPGSQSDADPQIRLARRTEWTEYEGGYHGLGQRMITTDAGEYALLDIRKIVFSAAGNDG